MENAQTLLFVLVLGLNFFISWLNARNAGAVWVETKQMGGFPRFMTWIGAIMSACGFTWCYLIVLLIGGYYVLPLLQTEGEAPLLTIEAVEAGLSLGYLIIIPIVLSTGMMIWIDSLVKAWKTRTLGTVGTAGWNTFAQMHNTYSAMRGVPEAFESVVNFFSSKSDKKGKGAVVILIVVLAILGGIITTMAIIKKYAGTVPIDRPYAFRGSRDN